jgi:G3E family GTPase
MTQQAALPVTVLTGFLGSGKTTSITSFPASTA